MLLSMTGYGRANTTYGHKTINIEVRSLNSKFLDVRLKTPQSYRDKETELRRLITERLERGKIDLTIELDSLEGDDGLSLNIPLFKLYYSKLSKIATELNMPQGDMMQAIIRLPNVVAPPDGEVSEEEWETVLAGLEEAMNNFNQFRASEGAAMAEDLKSRTKEILRALSELPSFEEERIGKMRQRLWQNLEEFLGRENVDENRFEQEVLFYLEKMDVTEEKVRLEQHCLFFLEELSSKETQKGRKLSFISQEMGREINTLGAKAYSSDIQKLVVQMKDELEKIKEQVANIV
ncbi:MAG TPA: YicC family protein [Saprospiraceae bacterium]|nr:YicC family protein [Saprospiraceae bacterium]